MQSSEQRHWLRNGFVHCRRLCCIVIANVSVVIGHVLLLVHNYMASAWCFATSLTKACRKDRKARCHLLPAKTFGTSLNANEFVKWSTSYLAVFSLLFSAGMIIARELLHDWPCTCIESLCCCFQLGPSNIVSPAILRDVSQQQQPWHTYGRLSVAFAVPLVVNR